MQSIGTFGDTVQCLLHRNRKSKITKAKRKLLSEKGSEIFAEFWNETRKQCMEWNSRRKRERNENQELNKRIEYKRWVIISHDNLYTVHTFTFFLFPYFGLFSLSFLRVQHFRFMPERIFGCSWSTDYDYALYSFSCLRKKKNRTNIVFLDITIPSFCKQISRIEKVPNQNEATDKKRIIFIKWSQFCYEMFKFQ